MVYSKVLELINGIPRTVDLSTNTLSVQGLQINAATGGGSITQAAHSSTTTYTIVWPQAQAASSGYALINDGAGNLSWAAASSPLVFTDSLVNTGGTVTLVNDSASPTASQYYGTNSGSTLGYYNLPVCGINQLTGDVTAGPGTGSQAASLVATSNATLTTLSALTTASSLATVGTISSGTWHGSIIGYTYGGTNAASQAAAQVNMSPMTTAGDLTFENTTPAPDRLPIGSNGDVLTVVSGLPAWAPASVSPGSIALTDNHILVGNSSNLAADVAMSGDATIVASGALTLATVNSNTGSFGSSTSIPSFTVNAKGLITAASGNAVVAPAGTLSGTTLNSTVVTSSLTSLGTQSQALNMGGFQINDLASPSVSTDAANKGYVDAAISGLTWKGPAQAYAASDVPLTGSTPLVIDGYTVLNGDLLLLANQTIASQNGEYSAAITGGSYALTANGLPNAVGDAWLITNGTVYGNSAFTASAAVPAATFVEFAGPTSLTFVAPLVLTGNTVTITQASGSANGYLSSTDWNTFNNKQPAGNYITALTGDASASGPGSATLTLATVNSNVGTFASVTVNGKGLVTAASALSGDATTSGSTLTLATVNSNVGSFTNASITVNAKGLITAASSGTAAVTSISVATANGLSGSSSGGTTPILTLSTTVNSPVLAGNGTAISAATTTGTGSTVVLSASPALTGTVTAANATLSGNLIAPVLQITATYNGAATLAANTTYALRWGLPANSETAGDLYVADWNTASFDLFWVTGLYNSTGTTSTGASITVTTQGNFTLGSSDTNFGSTDQGKAAWLGTLGTYIPNSTFSPASGDANEKLGIVTSATTIWVNPQMMGVS